MLRPSVGCFLIMACVVVGRLAVSWDRLQLLPGPVIFVTPHQHSFPISCWHWKGQVVFFKGAFQGYSDDMPPPLASASSIALA